LRQELKKQGRFVTLDALRPKLAAGEGTLLEETGPKGPYRIWWTEDELSPRQTDLNDPERPRRLFDGEPDEFNDRCLQEYLSRQNGRASLTAIPLTLARTGRLGEIFPKTRRVMIVHLSDEDGTI
jgi:hypothetical protein